MDQGQGTMMNDPSQPMPQMGGMPGMEGQDPAAMAAMSAPPPPGQIMEMGMEDQSAQDPMQKYIDFALSQANLAKHLRKKKDGESMLAKIGSEVVRGYTEDEASRVDWMKNNEEWMRLALLVRENKTYPWPKASNVKFPLIATAAMQFSARAYPSLVPSDGQIVKTSLPQKHPNKALVEAGRRVANHMSFQLRYIMKGWEEEMDKLLMTLAISGLIFKKTYYCGVEKKNKSCLVYPENLVVNYYAKSLASAYRKTEIIPYYKNDVRSKILNDEEFLDVLDEISASVDAGSNKQPVANKAAPPAEDSTTPLVFLSQHTFLDLDEDGYEEPYVITVHKESAKVVRIVARYDSDGVTRNEKGDIMHITPVEYFTDFSFIPNPDGSIYGLGFGALLGPLNVSVNTLINQLIDSGTLNNLQSGFIGKGLRIKMGETSFRPGEWKVVNATGDDLSKSVFPLPSKEPSAVLMNLLQMLIQSGNQLASIAEIFVGKMPGQNTPATTTQETVQQSMAVFTAIYKRVYRSMDLEFQKIYRLNKLNPDSIQQETELAGIPLETSDYDYPTWMIVPGADPAGDSFAVRQQKMQFIAQSILPLGAVNPQVYSQKALEMLELPDVDEWIQPPPPPQPDPKAQAMQMKAQIDQQKGEQDIAAKQADSQAKQEENQIKKEMMLLKAQMEEREAQRKGEEADRNMKFDQLMRMMEIQHTRSSNDIKLQTEAVSSQQKLVQNEQSFQQKQRQAKTKEKKNGPRTKD